MANRPGRIVIIGGGHNGLITAFYLAKAGFAPLVLERRDIVGGLAVTEEIHPGFRCPALAHVAGPLLPAVMKDLNLQKLGFELIKPDVQVLALDPDGVALSVGSRGRRTKASASSRVS